MFFEYHVSINVVIIWKKKYSYNLFMLIFNLLKFDEFVKKKKKYVMKISYDVFFSKYDFLKTIV